MTLPFIIYFITICYIIIQQIMPILKKFYRSTIIIKLYLNLTSIFICHFIKLARECITYIYRLNKLSLSQPTLRSLNNYYATKCPNYSNNSSHQNGNLNIPIFTPIKCMITKVSEIIPHTLSNHHENQSYHNIVIFNSSQLNPQKLKSYFTIVYLMYFQIFKDKHG